MNEPPLDNLESRLRDATTWVGPTTQLWKRALATESKPNILTFDAIAFAKRWWFPLVSGASAACLAVVLLTSSQFKSARMETTASLRGIGQAAYIYGSDGSQSPFESAKPSQTILRISPLLQTATPSAYPNFDSDKYGEGGELWLYGDVTGSVGLDTPITSAKGGGPSASPAGSSRHVIQKATVELSTPDVRAAFLKAGLILNEALGEHVQDSSLTGSGETASATLTLRVAASRLSEVSNALRELGTVVSERREGQDVTGQVIDVEARLRNEQRVEQELLALFDQRKDAPLKDVLDLRQKLSEVRSGIEQLVGQRDQLSRLVSLATVLVIIRTGEKPPEPLKEDGLWKYFRDATTHAWQSGLRGLADTVAALVAIFVGGLIWWVLLAIGLLLLRRYVRSRGEKA